MKAHKIADKLPKHKVVLNPDSYRMAHPVYSLMDIEKIEETHVKPTHFRDYFARTFVKTARKTFDILTRYNENKFHEAGWTNRCIFLETVAGVPGMVGGMARHLTCLRSMKRDNGWIHHLLEEAENER